MERQLSAEAVRDFLIRSPDFTEEYFAEHATSAMIQKWFQRRSKDNPSGKQSYGETKFSLAVQPEVAEDDGNEEGTEAVPDVQGEPSGGLRRNSEPITSAKNGQDAEFEIRGMRKKKALTQVRDRVALSNAIDEHTELVSLLYKSKTSLRKTQSAPTCKNIFNKLIKSSIYLRSIPTNNNQYKLELRSTSEDDFLKELIQDIVQDLNLKTLCNKIIVNIGILTKSDVASLYLIEKQEQRNVVRVCYENFVFNGEDDQNITNVMFDGRLQDIHEDREIMKVVETGTSYQDKNADGNTSDSGRVQDGAKSNVHGQKIYKPIENPNGEIVGVIALEGKGHSWTLKMENDNAFLNVKNPDGVAISPTEGNGDMSDKEVLERYLRFCAVSLTNAKLFSLSKEEFDRNKNLLQLAHEIFEEQTSLTNIIHKTMNRAINLFSCKECKVFLIADPKQRNLLYDEKFSHMYKMHQNSEKNNEIQFSSMRLNSMDIANDDQFSADHVIDFVSVSGKIYNSSIPRKIIMTTTDAGNDSEPVLCLPIMNNRLETIGVIKLTRRVGDDPFNEKDEQIFEAFTIFCGLGISNCILYDKVCRAKAHQKVALEVISYHTSASQQEVERLKLSPIPSVKAVGLKNFQFDDFKLRDDQMLTAAIRMFTDFDFIKTYRIENETLYRWLLTVKKNYRRVIYHNWRHAFNVAQSMFAILTTGKISEMLTSLECLALMVGCLCHDLDHRGTNNEFQTKSESALGKLYGTSIMEHHHFNQAVAILNSEGNNIFQNLTSSQYKEVMKLLKHAILATDLAQYLKFRKPFEKLVESKTYDLNRKEDRSMLRGILMTSSDLCGITKPWEVQKKVVHLVTSEFFHQGDMEREKLQVEPQAMMNREHILQLPRLQHQFFSSTGIPVYKVLARLNGELQPLLDNATANSSRWEELSHQVANGTIATELEPLLKPVNSNDNFVGYPNS